VLACLGGDVDQVNVRHLNEIGGTLGCWFVLGIHGDASLRVGQLNVLPGDVLDKSRLVAVTLDATSVLRTLAAQLDVSEDHVLDTSLAHGTNGKTMAPLEVRILHEDVAGATTILGARFYCDKVVAIMDVDIVNPNVMRIVTRIDAIRVVRFLRVAVVPLGCDVDAAHLCACHTRQLHVEHRSIKQGKIQQFEIRSSADHKPGWPVIRNLSVVKINVPRCSLAVKHPTPTDGTTLAVVQLQECHVLSVAGGPTVPGHPLH